MADWKKHFAKYASVIDDTFDDLVLNFRKRLGSFRPLQIVPYRSYGTARRVYIKGRVLEDKKIAAAADKDTILNNLVNMYKRFESDEVPGARLQAKIGNEVLEVTTDKEGYFVLDIHPKEPIIAEALWHSIPLELLDAPIPHEKGITAIAEVMIPPPDAEYGIISDIDDTIVKTTATDLLAMSRTTFLNNARTRLPFAGVAEFYRSLQLGRNGKRNNPFFYVSSSPWNLYDLLKDFLDLNKIPEGPLLLRDFGITGESTAGEGHLGHKLKEISQVMDAYPQLNFVLIGDSGQEDPVIYREVVKKYPNRVLAIYIRDVQLADREKIAMDVSKSLSEFKVEMVIVDNTVEAAEHAAKTGLIFTEAIPAGGEGRARGGVIARKNFLTRMATNYTK
jgi:phosphatidate phosphatase APP1